MAIGDTRVHTVIYVYVLHKQYYVYTCASQELQSSIRWYCTYRVPDRYTHTCTALKSPDSTLPGLRHRDRADLA